MTQSPSWFSAAVRRRLQIALYGVGVGVAILLTVILVAAVTLGGDFNLSDRLAAANVVFAGGALVLALVGSGIALQSFIQLTGSPQIEVQVWFGADVPNTLRLLVETREDGWRRSSSVEGQARLGLRFRNDSDFDASGVLVTVHLDGLFFCRDFDSFIGEWRVVDAIQGRGATGAEWSSRDVLLHAHSTRRIPDLDFGSFVVPPGAGPFRLRIYLAAAGYPSRPVGLPINVISTSGSAIGVSQMPTSAEWL